MPREVSGWYKAGSRGGKLSGFDFVKPEREIEVTGRRSEVRRRS